MAEEEKALATIDISDRRREVEKLKLRGISVSNIAKLLKIAPKTVYRDLEAVRAENKATLQTTDKDDHLSNAMSRYREIEERAWAEYHSSPEGSTQRIKALDLIRVTQSDKIKALKDTGHIQNQVQQLEVNVNHNLKEVWDPELQETVVHAMLQRALTPQLEEPVPESEIIEAELLPDDDE